MKIRITSEQLRFRLNDNEVEDLGKGKTLFLSVHLTSGSQTMNYEIMPSPDIKSVQAQHIEGSLIITIPENVATEWSKNEEEGVYSIIKTEIGTEITIAIEKDYPCKH